LLVASLTGSSSVVNQQSALRLRSLPADRPIEQDPQDQVIAEILEPMHYSGRDQQEIARAEAAPRAPAEELSPTLDDHIHLIAIVRRLGIVIPGGIELDGECSVVQQLDETFTPRARKPVQAIGHAELGAIR
jgi:hypothetical protein